MMLGVSLNQPHDDTVSPHVMNHGVHTGEIIGGFQIFHFHFLSCFHCVWQMAFVFVLPTQIMAMEFCKNTEHYNQALNKTYPGESKSDLIIMINYCILFLATLLSFLLGLGSTYWDTPEAIFDWLKMAYFRLITQVRGFLNITSVLRYANGGANAVLVC